MPRAKKTPPTPLPGPQLVKKPARKPSAQPVDPTVLTRIEQRAYVLFLESGGVHGYALDHWLAAEREIAGTASPAPVTRSAARGATRRVS